MPRSSGTPSRLNRWRASSIAIPVSLPLSSMYIHGTSLVYPMVTTPSRRRRSRVVSAETAVAAMTRMVAPMAPAVKRRRVVVLVSMLSSC